MSTMGGPRTGIIVVRNSSITNNTGKYIGPYGELPGPGIMQVDLSALPKDIDFDIVHYEVLIENCNFANNVFVGGAMPLFSTMYSQNFSANFLLKNILFSDNSLAMSTNISISFTVMKSSFLNCSLPLSAHLSSYDSLNVEFSVFESKFQCHNTPFYELIPLQVIQDLSGTSTSNISTNLTGNNT